MARINLAKAKTDKDTDFITAIAAAGAIEELDLDIPSKINACAVHQIRIIATDQLEYRLLFFATDGFADADYDLDSFIGWVDLDLVTNGVQIGGTGPWYYDARLAIPLLYVDDDRTEEFHIALQNNSAATPKGAGAAGEVSVELVYEPIF